MRSSPLLLGLEAGQQIETGVALLADAEQQQAVAALAGDRREPLDLVVGKADGAAELAAQLERPLHAVAGIGIDHLHLVGLAQRPDQLGGCAHHPNRQTSTAIGHGP